jgi:hypothetical protein
LDEEFGDFGKLAKQIGVGQLFANNGTYTVIFLKQVMIMHHKYVKDCLDYGDL